jgi:hypothetical protein
MVRVDYNCDDPSQCNSSFIFILWHNHPQHNPHMVIFIIPTSICTTLARCNISILLDSYHPDRHLIKGLELEEP